jgi:hypothetical protein
LDTKRLKRDVILDVYPALDTYIFSLDSKLRQDILRKFNEGRFDGYEVSALYYHRHNKRYYWWGGNGFGDYAVYIHDVLGIFETLRSRPHLRNIHKSQTFILSFT